MGCDTYSVWYMDVMLADKMSLETAMTLLKALFQENWKENGIAYIIKKNEVNEEESAHLDESGDVTEW